MGVTVGGTWFEGTDEGPYSAYLTVTGGQSYDVGLGLDNKWSALIRLYQAGTVTVTAHISSATGTGANKSQTFSVTLDSATVDAAVVQPAAGSTIQVGEGGAAVALVASTSADYGPRQMTWTATNGSTTRSGGADVSTADARLHTSTISLPPLPSGRWTLTVRSSPVGPSGAEIDSALAGTASATFTAADATPPHLDVRQPTDERTFVVLTPAMDVPVALAASDTQSQVRAVTCSVDGAAPTTLLSGDGSYTGTVRVTG